MIVKKSAGVRTLGASKPATSAPKTTTSAIDDLLREDAGKREIPPDRLALISSHTLSLAQLIVENGLMAAQIAENEKKMLELKNATLPGLMDEAQIPKLALEDGTTLERLDEVFGSVSKANAPKAADWLTKNGYASIVKFGFKIDVDQGDAKLQAKIRKVLEKARVGYEEVSGVHPQTLKAFIRESVEAGRKLPPVFSVHIQPTVKVSFPKVKK